MDKDFTSIKVSKNIFVTLQEFCIIKRAKYNFLLSVKIDNLFRKNWKIDRLFREYFLQNIVIKHFDFIVNI